MPDSLRIFIGSSNEARGVAEDIATLLFEIGGDDVTVRGWWDPQVFPPGRFFIESLRDVMRESDAAVLVASEDDKTTSRGNDHLVPRDNVILECGMSLLAHSAGRTALAVVGRPKLPSDLNGVNHLILQKSAKEFKPRNRGKIKELLEAWQTAKGNGSSEAKADLPKLYAAILKVVQEFQKNIGNAEGLDLMAAALLDSIAQHFSEDTARRGITKWVCNTSALHLKQAKAIWATDVLGPSTWLTPNAFRYLAIQIREYFRANTIRRGARFKFSRGIGDGLRRASENMKRRSGRESFTKFDDQFVPEAERIGDDDSDANKSASHDFQWAAGKVELEFARILLWTEDEFRSRITESISNIHEAFHVPLFGLVVRPDAPEREFDFIAFVQGNDSVRGFYNTRKERTPEPIEGGQLPHGSCHQRWERLFSHPDLMFAADIHHLLGEGVALAPML